MSMSTQKSPLHYIAALTHFFITQNPFIYKQSTELIFILVQKRDEVTLLPPDESKKKHKIFQISQKETKY